MLEKNSTSSGWVDILELAQSQDIEVFDSKGQSVTEGFIQALLDYQKEHEDRQAGICWRWALHIKAGMVMMIVQALPCSLKAIKASAVLSSDGAAGITIAAHPLGYDRFESPATGWPVPTMFSSEPTKAQKALQESPEFAYECLQDLVANLLERQELTAEQAAAYLADPSQGRIKRPFKKAMEAKATSSRDRSNSSSSHKPSKEEKGNYPPV